MMRSNRSRSGKIAVSAVVFLAAGITALGVFHGATRAGAQEPEEPPVVILPVTPGLPPVIFSEGQGRIPSLKERSRGRGGWCGTHPATAAQIARERQDMQRLRQMRSRRQSASRLTSSSSATDRNPGSVIIPVYVHVISKTDGTGNVSDNAVHEQIKILNIAYSGQDLQATQTGQGPSAQTSANTPFRFVLGATGVTRTPNGTSIINGISRTVNNTWHLMSSGSTSELEAKTALKVGRAGTLNIYVADTGGSLGYAYLPSSGMDSFVKDGVVILYRTFPGGNYTRYNYGDTATHEVGHWLGLEHTFKGGCDSDAVNGGDRVSDTPAELQPFYGRVPPTPDSCSALPGRDPVENFMDYTDDDCMFQFTPGQSIRMDDMHALYRRNL